MNQKRAVGFLVIIAATAFASVAKADTVAFELVLKSIREKSTLVKSFKAECVQKLSSGIVLAAQTVYFKKPDRIRVEQSTLIRGRKVDSVTVFDGAFQWTDSEGVVAKLDKSALRSITQEVIGSQQPLVTWGDPASLFNEAASHGSLAYLGQHDEDGKSMYVIEFTSRHLQRAVEHEVGHTVPEMTLRYWVSVDDGLIHKVAEYERGAMTSAQSIRYVQLNENIPDTLFTFTPPSGIQVIDLTDEMRKRSEAGRAGGISDHASSEPPLPKQ